MLLLKLFNKLLYCIFWNLQLTVFITQKDHKICACLLILTYPLSRYHFCFASNFVTSLLNSVQLSYWNSFWYLNTTPFHAYNASNTNATSLAFLVLRAQAALYLDATSIYVYVSFKDIIRYIKQIKLMLLIRFCHLVIREF